MRRFLKFAVFGPKFAFRDYRTRQQVCVDPPHIFSPKPALGNEVQHFVVPRRFESRQTREIGEYPLSVAQGAAGEFTDNERVAKNQPLVE